MIGYGARQHIRKNALQHLHQEITITRRDGSFTFEECLAQLVRRGVLSLDEARARAMHRDEFDGLIARVE
jgi:twitching motility protein PilT